MARFELLVGSSNFWSCAVRDVQKARRRVLVQAMTFEGDTAGLAVGRAVQESSAGDRRVLVDDYTRHNLNDTMLGFGGLRFNREPKLMAEAEATWAMFDRLAESGAGVRVTDPVGRNPLRFVLRNHKKLLAMDDVSWIGGINFADHNFEWHDFMLRIDDAAVTEWLAAEFEADWRGEPRFARAEFGPELALLSLDGATNEAGFAEVLELFAGARKSIEVLSAYPTQPFTDVMGAAAARGVDVTIVTPRPNNKPVVRDFLLGFAPEAGIDLRLLPAMTHAKLALIDGETLLLGSSNFDFASYRANNEYVAIIRDRALISQAKAELLEPAYALAERPRMEELGGWKPRRAKWALKAAESVLKRLGKGPRIAEWSHPPYP